VQRLKASKRECTVVDTGNHWYRLHHRFDVGVTHAGSLKTVVAETVNGDCVIGELVLYDSSCNPPDYINHSSRSVTLVGFVYTLVWTHQSITQYHNGSYRLVLQWQHIVGVRFYDVFRIYDERESWSGRTFESMFTIDAVPFLRNGRPVVRILTNVEEERENCEVLFRIQPYDCYALRMKSVWIGCKME
jgi:hypothetical protein